MPKKTESLEIKNLHEELHNRAWVRTKDCRTLVMLAYERHYGFDKTPHESVDFDEALEHVDYCKVCLQRLIGYLPKPSYLIVEPAHQTPMAGFVWPFGPFGTDDEAKQWGRKFKEEAKEQGLEVSYYLLDSIFQPKEPKAALAPLYRPALKSNRRPVTKQALAHS